MTGSSPKEQVRSAVLQWEGVSVHPHRFNGQEYRLGSRELGHLHGDTLLDVPFPTRIRKELVAAGRAQRHHILPDSGWVSFYIRDAGDVAAAIELLRLSYDLAREQKSKRRGKRKNAETQEGDSREV